MSAGGGSGDRGRVLVTGGSGLIGRAAVAELACAGYRPVVLSRSPEKVRGLPAGARAAGWDGETADGWGELADGAAGIVHLAGEGIADGRWSDGKRRRIRDSRVLSGRAVLAAIEAAGERPGFLLQGSAVGYYGSTGDRPIDESAPPGEGFLPETCIEWEAATAPAERLGVRRAVLRTGIVLATEGGALPKMALPYRLFVGGRIGSGEQYVPWIHRADVARAIRFLAESPEASGPFNLTAPEPVRNRELSREIARALGRPDLFRAPALALRLVLGDLAETVLTGQRALPAALERLGFEFRYRELRPALEELLG